MRRAQVLAERLPPSTCFNSAPKWVVTSLAGFAGGCRPHPARRPQGNALTVVRRDTLLKLPIGRRVYTRQRGASDVPDSIAPEILWALFAAGTILKWFAGAFVIWLLWLTF